jgi:hypothetical protein
MRCLSFGLAARDRSPASASVEVGAQGSPAVAARSRLEQTLLQALHLPLQILHEPVMLSRGNGAPLHWARCRCRTHRGGLRAGLGQLGDQPSDSELSAYQCLLGSHQRQRGPAGRRGLRLLRFVHRASPSHVVSPT